jgi:hypothetical protein
MRSVGRRSATSPAGFVERLEVRREEALVAR